MPYKKCSPEDEKLLNEPARLHIGSYYEQRQHLEFVIEIDARPLALLIEEAYKGRRVYEFLSIDRPGDLLNYLWVRVAEGSSELIEYITQRYNRARRFSKPQESVHEMTFTEFDGYFDFDFDDTRPDASIWIKHRDSAAWRRQPMQLLPVVRRAQANLTHLDDFLTQHEIALMALGQHHLDFRPTVDRDGQLMPGVPGQSTLPSDLFELIVRLVKQEDIRSVSCPFTDYWLWRELVAEQVRRSIAQGVEPMTAMELNGPDSGIPFVSSGHCRTVQEWGGEIHIPCEGTRGGDLFIQPDWFGFTPADARLAPTLSQAVFEYTTPGEKKTCSYLLTRFHNLGEITSAKRTVVGDWVLYGPRTMSFDQGLASAMK